MVDRDELNVEVTELLVFAFGYFAQIRLDSMFPQLRRN